MIPFIITIDTEGDNIWARPKEFTTENAKFLPRFQALAEKYNLKPTYLTNYEMAIDPVFIAMAKDAIVRNTAEVGMHIHAWNSPPLTFLASNNDLHHHPYLIEYSDEAIEAKVVYITELLTKTFGKQPTCHRAGRWSMNSNYAKILIKHGYLVDCSVTPHINWRGIKGAPQLKGGTDYRRFPEFAYFMDENQIHKKGSSPLLQVPMSTRPRYTKITDYFPSIWFASNFLFRATGKILPIDWLRPFKNNEKRLFSLLERAKAEQWPHLEFMMHSSEFMPGGSPYFKDDAAVEALFKTLDRLFKAVSECCVGMTLSEYRNHYITKQNH